MIRGIRDSNREIARQRALKGIRPKPKTSNPLEAFCIFIPIVLVFSSIFAFFYALQYRAAIPLACVDSPEQLLKCYPSDIVIAIMSGDSHYSTRAKTCNNTWVQHARNLGITVLFFGESPNPSLPAIGLATDGEDIQTWQGVAGYGNFKRTFRMWEWVHENFKHSKRWFMKVDDDTFIHPYFLVNEIICRKDPFIPQYIGEGGPPAIFSHGRRFHSGGAGYLLSLESLELLLQARDEDACPDFYAEDVTVGRCMDEKQIPLTSSTLFHSEYPHGYFTPQDEFVSYHHVNPTDMLDLSTKSFGHCKNYKQLQLPKVQLVVQI